jgi:hypothetical protein
MLPADFLKGISRAHADQRIVIEQPMKEDAKAGRIMFYGSNHRIDVANGTTISAC